MSSSGLSSSGLSSSGLALALLALTALPLAGCEGGGAPGASRESLATHPALTPLDAPSREAVARAPVPVLLLPEPYAETSTVTAARGFYAIAAEDGELSVSLHATDVVHASGDGVPAPPRQHTVRGRPALVLVNEGIRSVTWEEGAVSYALEVECYRPFEDARCTEAAFVLALADALVEVDR